MIGGDIMKIFDAYLKGGECVSGDDWDQVPVHLIDVLVVHHIWNPGVSMAITGPGDLFFYKEAISSPGSASKIIAVYFGRICFGKKTGIKFSEDGSIQGGV